MYYVKCNKFRKFVNPKISLIFDKILECYIFAVNVIIMIEYSKRKKALKYQNFLV